MKINASKSASLAALTLLAATLLAQTTAPNPPPPHLRDADLIAHNIDSAHNQYLHKDCFIKWKGEDGATLYENATDCSDFLNLLLQHSYKLTPANLHTLTGHDRPTATIWYDTIAAAKGFDVIPTLKQIQPGDILAIQYPAGQQEDTGHIMLAASAPQPRKPSAPLVDKTDQWELAVIDSSKSGHGTKDTRHHPDATYDRGVGQGTVRLYSNPDGTLAGYSWSTLSASTFEPSSLHKIIVGRLQAKTIHPAP